MTLSTTAVRNHIAAMRSQAIESGQLYWIPVLGKLDELIDRAIRYRTERNWARERAARLLQELDALKDRHDNLRLAAQRLAVRLMQRERERERERAK